MNNIGMFPAQIAVFAAYLDDIIAVFFERLVLVTFHAGAGNGVAVILPHLFAVHKPHNLAAVWDIAENSPFVHIEVDDDGFGNIINIIVEHSDADVETPGIHIVI